MQITLGKLDLTIHWIGLFDSLGDLMFLPPFENWLAKRKLYHWDCARQSGDPRRPPKTVILPSYLHFHALDAQGQPDPKAAGDMLDRFVRAAGMKTREELSDAFSAICPDFTIPVNAAVLIDPFKPNYTFDVLMFPEYKIFHVSANGGRMGDFALIGLPTVAAFQTRFVASCNGAPEPAAVLAGDTRFLNGTEFQRALGAQFLEDAALENERSRERF